MHEPYEPDYMASPEGEDAPEAEMIMAEDMPEALKSPSPEEKIEAVLERLHRAEVQCQLPSGILNLFEDLYAILEN